MALGQWQYPLIRSKGQFPVVLSRDFSLLPYFPYFPFTLRHLGHTHKYMYYNDYGICDADDSNWNKSAGNGSCRGANFVGTGDISDDKVGIITILDF